MKRIVLLIAFIMCNSMCYAIYDTFNFASHEFLNDVIKSIQINCKDSGYCEIYSSKDSILVTAGRFKKHKPCGTWKVFNILRNSLYILNFISNSTKIEVILLSDSKIKTHYYLNRFLQLDSVYTKYYPNGLREIEVNYKEGKLHGKYIKWLKDGTKIFEGIYCTFPNIDSTCNCLIVEGCLLEMFDLVLGTEWYRNGQIKSQLIKLNKNHYLIRYDYEGNILSKDLLTWKKIGICYDSLSFMEEEIYFFERQSLNMKKEGSEKNKEDN